MLAEPGGAGLVTGRCADLSPCADGVRGVVAIPHGMDAVRHHGRAAGSGTVTRLARPVITARNASRDR
ncbi:hypothetical protein T261_07943 [Streptomyces lydicus]|nr:hypothetical protein T261_07943 [Streptomyces lydicus]